MAISTEDLLIAALATAQHKSFNKASQTTSAGFYHTLWNAAGNPGAGAISVGAANGAVPTDATAGAFPITDASAGKSGYLSHFDAHAVQIGVVILYDRLWHSGSHAMTPAAPTTTTLSSPPALSRAGTDPVTASARSELGVGTELWCEINVAPNAATAITVSYTNDGGTAGHTATLDTSVTGALTGRMYPFRLASGDTGVRSIQSFTLTTASSTGSFNLVILRKLTEMGIPQSAVGDQFDPFLTGLANVWDDSCLALMFLPNTTSTGFVGGTLDIAQN